MPRPLTPAASGRQSFILHNIILCLASAALFRLGFPPFDLGWTGWFCFVPLLILLNRRRAGAAFGWGYVFGLIFFAAALFWVHFVTWLGMVVLVFYLALYPAIFAAASVLLSGRGRGTGIFLLPALWVATEYLRGVVLTGFPWLLAGHTQSHFLAVVQIADATGVAGVSFLVLMVNVLLMRWWVYFRSPDRGQERPALLGATATVAAALIFVGAYGSARLKKTEPSGTVRVGVIQPNIPLAQHWQPSEADNIISTHLRLSEAAAAQKPDVILWPESTYPGIWEDSPRRMERIRDFARRYRMPVLLGAVTQHDEGYYNSAVLIGADGDPSGQYDKLHLVPYGEYIPFRRQFPFLSGIVPIDDFTAGAGPALVRFSAGPAPGHSVSAGVLICFEDTIPDVTRRLVRAGADVLVNLTNDAWYDDSPAAFLHLQAAVFRAVESRRSLIRCTNTGVSALIAPSGKVLRILAGPRGRVLSQEGQSVWEVELSRRETFYIKFGDIFTTLCFGGILLSVLRTLRTRLRPE